MIFMVNLTKESADKISPYATEVAAVLMKTKFQRCCSRLSNLKKTIGHYLYSVPYTSKQFSAAGLRPLYSV